MVGTATGLTHITPANFRIKSTVPAVKAHTPTAMPTTIGVDNPDAAALPPLLANVSLEESEVEEEEDDEFPSVPADDEEE